MMECGYAVRKGKLWGKEHNFLKFGMPVKDEASFREELAFEIHSIVPATERASVVSGLLSAYRQQEGEAASIQRLWDLAKSDLAFGGIAAMLADCCVQGSGAEAPRVWKVKWCRMCRHCAH